MTFVIKIYENQLKVCVERRFCKKAGLLHKVNALNIRIVLRVISKYRHFTKTTIFTKRVCSVCGQNPQTFY